MDPLKIAGGILLLLLGRRLFWLFVGLIGFWAGMMFATHFFTNLTGPMLWIIAFACGVVGILLAIFLQRLAIAIAGFLSAGYAGVSLANQFGLITARFDWAVFLIAGILGAILLSLLFDWALIFLSSAAGAALLTEGAHLSRSFSMIAFLILFIAGILIQSRIMIGQRRAATST